MDNVALQGQKLECLRNERQLFIDLSFQLNSGQVMFLQGPNGSGKTTLLRMVCGFRLPEKGAILWNGEDISYLGNQYTSQVTYIGHHPGVKRDLTVEENLAVMRGLITTKASIDIEAILDQLHLFAHGDQLVAHLSAGQQRRVALARLLMAETPLWVLDEPYTSLDKNVVVWLESLFKKHVEAGGMIILTSHQAVNLSACDVVSLELG